MGWQEGLMLLSGLVFISAVIYVVHSKWAANKSHEEDYDDYEDPEEAERRAELERELPGLFQQGKRKTSQQGLDPLFDEIEVFDDDPIPVLRNKQPTVETLQAAFANKLEPRQVNQLSNPDEETTDEELAWAKMRRMFSVDPAFAEASRSAIELKQRELQQLQERKRLLAEQQQVQELKAQALALKEQETKEELEHHALEAQYLAEQSDQAAMDYYNHESLAEEYDSNSETEDSTQSVEAFEMQLEETSVYADHAEQLEQSNQMAEMDSEERERDLRTALLANLEKNAWGSSEVFLTINVNAPAEQPFVGDHLAKFMDMIGMKLSETGFYHYVEEKDGQPYLGFSLVNMFSPGCFSPDMDEDFTTAGVVLVMPLPNTPLPMAVFERMLATAKVMEQSWSAELQDEQRSNLTQQTIEHYRQTIKDFEYQTRVNAKKAGRT